MFSFLERWSLSSHDAEIKSIVNEFHWSPEIINNLFCDDIDYHGLIYWYEHISEMHAKIPKK